MKRFFLAFVTILLVAPLLVTPVSAAKSYPTVHITLLNPVPEGFELGVGQTYTFRIFITSDQPFLWATALPDAFYPGRGVYWHDNDRSGQANTAELQMTVKGKSSTAGLPTVCDWPTAGTCWAEGTAPLAIAVGVRFKGGQVAAETFAFAIKVP